MDEHTQLAMALSISMLGDKEQGSTAIELPIKDPTVKPKKKPRGRKKKKTDEDPDEQTQIAMAISASLADETKQKNKDLGKNEERPGKKTRARPKKKLKKIHQEFPVLLTRKDDERQKILEGRISALLEPTHSEDIIFSDHVFQRSNIRTKYSDPDSLPLTKTYPGNIRIKSGLQLWNATGADLSWKQTGKSPFYVEQLQPMIVPLTPKSRTSPVSHQVFSKTPTKTPSKQSPKAVVLSNKGSVEESFSVTQSLGMTVQCLAELAEEGLHDSTSLSSDKCGFIPQEKANRNRLSDDQLDLLGELSRLVNSPTMSDAVIQIDDGSKLHVHSFMMQLRCPALAALLAKPFERKSTSLPSIVVSDIGYEAMENALSYIYSATVNITNYTAVETHKFAERFKMADLASHCKPYLQDDTDPKITRKGSELDIVDKDLNQLIDSLWEDEEDDKEEKNRDAGRTSDDEVNDPIDDDEIKEIYDVAASQRSRSMIESSGDEEDYGDDFLFREVVYSSVSSPKNIEDDGEGMRDEDSAEEELNKMILTQTRWCRRNNTVSYCSRDNSSDGDDNEDWSMAIDDEVVVQGEVNAQCVTPLAKRTTDERKDMIGENLNECTEDVADETPKGTYNSRRRVSVSSSSNETITDEHHHISFEESHHSFLNQTLVRERNVSAISRTDRHKKRTASPETSNISKGLECGDGVKVLHKRFLDTGVEHSESPDDEVLFLRMDSAESESDGQNRILEKSLSSQVENSTGMNGKVQDCGFDDTDQGRLSSSRKKKLLIQQYSPQTDSDDNRSPPEQAASYSGNEIQVVSTKESESREIIDTIHRTSSVVLKKLSLTLECNRLDEDGDTRQKRFASQSSTENHDDRGLKKRQESLDWSLSEGILSPSPPPSPKFSRASQIPRLSKMVEGKRGPNSKNNHLGLDHSRSLNASQIPRLEKMVESNKSPISRNYHLGSDHSRSLNASPKIKAESLEEEEDDPYQLSPSSSTSSRKESNHPSSSKRKKKKRVKRETLPCGNGSSLSSPSFESSASSKDTNRRWSSLRMDQDLPCSRSRDSFHCEASPELLHELSPSASPPVLHRISPSPSSPERSSAPGASPVPLHRISPSPSIERSSAPGASPVPLHRISLSPSSMERSSAPGASPVPGASPAVSTSPSVSYGQSPYPDTQDMDEDLEERFAYDMEEGCGYDDFHVGIEHPNDEDDVGDAGIVHQDEMSVEDGEGCHRNGEIREGIMTESHQNEHFEEENEIDLTKEEEEEDRLTDDVHLPSSAFRDGSRNGGGFPMQVSHKEPEQEDEYNSIGTPHVKHYQRPLLGGGPGNGPKSHRLSQSLTTTPRTSQSNAASTGAVLKTPSISRLMKDEYYSPAPITPMPNYDLLMTPELKKELKRYGVKPLGKKKAKLLLAEIHSYLHQVMPEDESDEDTSSTAMTKAEPEPSKGRSKKGKATKQKPAAKRGKAQARPREESSSDDRQFKETNSKKSNIQKKQTKPRKRKKAEGGLDETPTKRVKTERPLKERILDTARRGIGTEDSTGLDEPVSSQGSHSSSIDSNQSDFGESIYHEDLEEEDDDVMATQQVQDMSTEVKRYIMRNKELHQKILHYEALNLEEFYKELKEAKVQCSKVKLMEFLDHQCVTFRGQGGSRQRKPKKAKTKTKR